MSKYSITATKKDYQYAFDQILKLEKQLGERFDWKKIKRVSLDELITLIGVLNRRLPAKEDDVLIGRRGHAIDFFEEYPEELIKYAKTKGLVALSEVKTAIDMARETQEVNCLGTMDKYSRDEIIQAITK